jgi:purine nucleoside permease
MRSQFFAALQLLSVASASLVPAAEIKQRAIEYVVKPKIFIISMFDPEAEVWYGIPEFDILGLNITVPGFSPLFPDAHCTANGDVCQLVTGESGECGHFEYLAVRRQC